MIIREKQEEWERQSLSPYAALSSESRGRDVDEPQCDLRPIYQRDRDRILHSKSFRRLKDKTQVFLSPEGDHYRTRLTHTLEVSQNARTIARALRLNEDLTEAIALGHDLGHTPFGHAGERALSQALWDIQEVSLTDSGKQGTEEYRRELFLDDGRPRTKFHHNEQSIRVVEKLEKKGQGLNLTWEVRDGILNHRSACMPSTMEGKIVRYADKIAYINHDIDDAIRAGIIAETDLPGHATEILGHTTRDRINSMIHDIVMNSENEPDICMSKRTSEAMAELRSFMFTHVYFNPKAKSEEVRAESMIRQLFSYYYDKPTELPEEYIQMMKQGEKIETVVCDYIAGMTDTFAVHTFENLFVPKSWQG
jgi:dGTPase